MQLFQLLRKDVLLVRKLAIVTMILLIILTIFITRTAPILAGRPMFLYITVIAELMLFQAISQTEAKSPRAVALLCAAPYSRKTIVQAKYALFLVVFAYCYLVYSLVNLVLDPKNLLDISSVLFVLLINVIIQAIYLPIEFRYGLVKAKFIFMGAILAFSMGPSLLAPFFSDIKIDFSGISMLPNAIKISAMALATIGILGASMLTSYQIFDHKDL